MCQQLPWHRAHSISAGSSTCGNRLILLDRKRRSGLDLFSTPLSKKEQQGVKSLFPAWAMIWPAFSLPPTVRSIIRALVKNSCGKNKRIMALWPRQCEEIILQLGNAWEFQLLTKWNCKTNRPQQDHEQSGLGFRASDEISKTLN